MHTVLNYIDRNIFYTIKCIIYQYQRFTDLFKVVLQTFAKPFAVENLLTYFL